MALLVDATVDEEATADGDATVVGGAVHSDTPAGELACAEHAAAVDSTIAQASICPHEPLTKR
jgi:hypothetical protein